MQRIDAHSCLRVWQVDRCLQSKPEIGELVGKLAFARHILVRKLTASYNHRSFVCIQRTQEDRNIFGIMLPVCIQRQGIVKTHF